MNHENSKLLSYEMHEGHSTMDKALACHTSGRGLNPDTTIAYSAPILSDISLSHNTCCHVLNGEYLSQCGKKRGIMVIFLAEPSVR